MSDTSLIDVARGAEASRRAAWAAYYRLAEQHGVEGTPEPPPVERKPQHPTVLWLAGVVLPAESQGSSALAASSRAVAHVLSRYVNWDGFAWPSVDSISLASGLSNRSVRTHLHELRSAGWLELVEEGGDRAGGTNVWRVEIPHHLRDLVSTTVPDFLNEPPAQRRTAPAARLAERAVIQRALTARITGSQWRTLGALLYLVSKYDRTTDHVANSQLASLTGMDPRHVRKALKDLADLGIIEREPGSGRVASKITLNVEAAEVA